MIIIVAGLPGSGKGTQGHFLAEHLGYKHIATGDIFRDIVSKDAEDARLIKQYMASGALVPSSLVNKMVSSFLEKNNYSDNYILDGYPRNVEQAKYFSKIVSNVRVVYFNLSEATALKRIAGRFSCSSCKQIYNQNGLLPKIENVCDICSGVEFTHRADDEASVVSCRIKEYTRETQPMIEYYKEQNILITVDAERKQEEVSSSLLDLLKTV